jgi:hypothetical protein
LRKRNYLNNKDILVQIHKSKNTFSSFTSPQYHLFDIILSNLDDIYIPTTEEFDEEGNPFVKYGTVDIAKRNKAKRLSSQAYETRKLAGEKVKQAECEVKVDSITTEELIFRVMTFEHIPAAPGRKRTPKTVADTCVKLNFPPFVHYKYNNNGLIELVGKSHWKGDLDSGQFNREHGQATTELAKMWLKLCDRYATRGNVRGYTYNDEMRGQAILQLSQIGLQFDESKSQNPFAYYTAAVTNSFVRVINIEKRNQNVRDDILEMNELTPSYTRQQLGQWESEVKRNQDDY